MPMKQRPGKSPFKAEPRRLPGQSLTQSRDERIFVVLQYLVGSLFTVILAVLEWMRAIQNAPPQPWVLTIFALLVCIWLVPKAIRNLRDLKQISLGIRGEIHVGQNLEELRDRGIKVLHDIPGDGWNIDHVLIGEMGVFSIETKTRWKISSNVTVNYDGEALHVAGHSPDRDPIIQAKGQARFLHETIQYRAGLHVTVRPVVLFPGWFVDGSSSGKEVWVLNEKSLPGFLEHEPKKLSPMDVIRITSVIEDHCRSKSSV